MAQIASIVHRSHLRIQAAAKFIYNVLTRA